MGYSFKDYLRDRGEFIDDEEVFSRAPLTERVFREFKLGIFTMFVITMLLVALFYDEREPRRPEGPVRPAEQPADKGLLARITGLIFKQKEKEARPETRPGAQAQARPSRPAPAPLRHVAPAPPRFVEKRYVARRGDTLYSISRKVYGDGTKWKIILQRNPELRGRPENLSAGMKLRIPVKVNN